MAKNEMKDILDKADTQTKTESSSTFCAVPWTQVATNSSGLYRVCCNALPVLNLVKDDSGKNLSVTRDQFDDVWYAATYKKIREQMLNSERPEMCRRCFAEEDSGVESARIRYNKKYPHLFESQNSIEPKPSYLDLRLGNLCNLKCRMCNPYSSNKWVDEWNLVVDEADLLPGNTLPEAEKARLTKMNWPDDPRTWKNLEAVLPYVDELYLTGGEPFLSTKQVKLLNKMVELGYAPDVILKYNTNMTVLPKQLIEAWKDFKLIRLNVSLDGFGELLHYIRFPASWADIEQNLNKAISLKNKNLPLEIGIHVTVQMYNILSIVEIFEFYTTEFGIKPYLNILNHPTCLNIRTLPENLKQRVIQSIESSSMKEDLKKVSSYLEGGSSYHDNYQEFVRYTKKLDQIRVQSFAEFFPEFPGF